VRGFATGRSRFTFRSTVDLRLQKRVAARGAAQKLAERAALLFFAGILLFSGSLYGLALSGMRILAFLTPLGGLALIAGWIVLALAALKLEKP